MGFLMLPVAEALPLGLALYGTGNYALADGSVVTNFLAQGAITVLAPSQTIPPKSAPPIAEPETVSGTIVLGGDGALGP